MKHSLAIFFLCFLLIILAVYMNPASKEHFTTQNQTPVQTLSVPPTAAFSTPDTAPTLQVLRPVSIPQDIHGCPATLTHPPEEFVCPRDLSPAPETYPVADPLHPTQQEMDALPVNFPGIDRTLLVTAALKDPCVIEFLQSGGNIEGITDQPRPSNGKETVRWPPVVLAYRRINCTEMIVLFDIDPSAGNVSGIRIELK